MSFASPHEGEGPPCSPQPVEVKVEPNNVDEAWKFLESHSETTPLATTKELRRVRRKADFSVLPLLFACYMLHFIDKALLNYAGVMGLKKDLGLKGNDFSNAATAFWIAYLAIQPLNAWFLQKIPAAKWFALNMIFWGLITAATAAVKNYTGLLLTRIFLGATEATIIPSLLLISSQWYTKSEQALRFAIWSTGIGFGQIFGALISFGFQHAKDNAWKIMFIVVGIFCGVFGLANMFLLPSTPMGAWFLTSEEKVHLLRHISANQTGVRNSSIRWYQAGECLRDPQVWLICLIIILQTETTGMVSVYSSTVINIMGFDPKHAILLTAPAGVVSIFFTLLVGFGARKVGQRWAWVALCCIPGSIGAALMSFLPKSNTAGVLMGMYLLSAIIAPFPLISNWLASNCAGHTKRALASSLLAAAFSVGNIIGPQTFQARDAPEYRPAKIAVLATQASSAVVTVVLHFYYVWENKRRDARQSLQEKGEQGPTAGIEDWVGMTDRENPRFRYVH